MKKTYVVNQRVTSIVTHIVEAESRAEAVRMVLEQEFDPTDSYEASEYLVMDDGMELRPEKDQDLIEVLGKHSHIVEKGGKITAGSIVSVEEHRDFVDALEAEGLIKAVDPQPSQRAVPGSKGNSE